MQSRFVQGCMHNLHKLGEGLFHHFLVPQSEGAQHQVEGSLWVRLGIQHSVHGLHGILQQRRLPCLLKIFKHVQVHVTDDAM